MNDLLKKLLAGIPQQNELVDQVGNSPAYEVAPNLNPSIYPSPMAYPERKPTLDFTNEQPDVIQASVPKPTIKPSLPFMPKQELPAPQEEAAPIEKRASLADLLANMSSPKKDEELAQAQAGSNDMIYKLLMAKGANQIAQGFVNQKNDPNFLNDHIAMAKKPVEDLQARRKSEMEQEDQGFKRKNQVLSEQKALFELGDKEKENDPNSDVSKAFREYMASYAKIANVPVAISDKMSMADLQKTTGMLGNIVSAKMAQDAKKENAALQRESMSADKANKADMKNVDFIERQAKIMRESKNYKAAQSSESLVSLIDDAIKNPSAVKEIAATYETIKTLDPDSAVREGEVGLLQQGMTYRAQLNALASKATSNPKVYGPEFLTKMKEYAQFKKELAKKLYDKEFQGLARIGKRRGLSDDDINVMNPMYGREETSQQKPLPNGNGEIERKTKDGKIAIFDSNKNFLRYKE